MSEQFDQQVIVPDELGAKRFDQIAAACFPDFSPCQTAGMDQEWSLAGQRRAAQAQGKIGGW